MAVRARRHERQGARPDAHLPQSRISRVEARRYEEEVRSFDRCAPSTHVVASSLAALLTYAYASPARADPATIGAALEVGPVYVVRREYDALPDGSGPPATYRSTGTSGSGSLRISFTGRFAPRGEVGLVLRLAILGAPASASNSSTSPYATFEVGPILRFRPPSWDRGFYGSVHGGYCLGLETFKGFAAGFDVGYRFHTGGAHDFGVGLGFVYQQTGIRFENGGSPDDRSNRLVTPTVWIEILPNRSRPTSNAAAASNGRASGATREQGSRR